MPKIFTRYQKRIKPITKDDNATLCTVKQFKDGWCIVRMNGKPIPASKFYQTKEMAIARVGELLFWKLQEK